jgi:hypothetical protein
VEEGERVTIMTMRSTPTPEVTGSLMVLAVLAVRLQSVAADTQ